MHGPMPVLYWAASVSRAAGSVHTAVHALTGTYVDGQQAAGASPRLQGRL